MPTQLLRACTYPGCAALVPRGRCTQHPYPRKYTKRPSSTQQGYDSKWAKARAIYLKMHPRCELRLKCSGAPATEVDHITPMKQGGTHDFSNLQAACKPCHSTKTARHDVPRDNGGRFSGH